MNKPSYPSDKFKRQLAKAFKPTFATKVQGVTKCQLTFVSNGTQTEMQCTADVARMSAAKEVHTPGGWFPGLRQHNFMVISEPLFGQDLHAENAQRKAVAVHRFPIYSFGRQSLTEEQRELKGKQGVELIIDVDPLTGSQYVTSWPVSKLQLAHVLRVVEAIDQLETIEVGKVLGNVAKVTGIDDGRTLSILYTAPVTIGVSQPEQEAFA